MSVQDNSLILVPSLCRSGLSSDYVRRILKGEPEGISNFILVSAIAL